MSGSMKMRTASARQQQGLSQKMMMLSITTLHRGEQHLHILFNLVFFLSDRETSAEAEFILSSSHFGRKLNPPFYVYTTSYTKAINTT